MGKISEYIIELSETFGDLLDKHGNYEAAIDDMRDLLSKDEFEFFGAHLDIIEDNLGFTDGIEGPESLEESSFDQIMADEETWVEHFDDALENEHGLSPREIDELTMQFHKSIVQYFDEKEYPNIAAEKIVKAWKGVYEASGIKGDVLRPWGGRKARSKMGFGKGNRAGYRPEDEIPTEDELNMEDVIMQDIEDDDGAPMTSTIIDGEEIWDVGSKKPDWPEEMRDEEDWDEDDDVPYPGGMTQDDLDECGSGIYEDGEIEMEELPEGPGPMKSKYNPDEEPHDSGAYLGDGMPGERDRNDHPIPAIDPPFHKMNPDEPLPEMPDDGGAMVPDDEIAMPPLELDQDVEAEVVVDEPDEFALKVGGEEETQTPMHYDLDYDKDMDEDPYMEPIEEHFENINEDWTFIQEAILVLAAGAIAISLVTGKKDGSEEMGWRKWAERFIPALKRKRVTKEIKQGVTDYGEEKIDIDALEEILNQDPSLQKTIHSLKTGNKYGYAQLYNRLKSHLDVYTIDKTPIKKIKGEFNKKGEEYKLQLQANKKAAKDALEAFGNGENDIQAVLTALSASDEPGWGGLYRAFDKLVQDPKGYYNNFYRAIKSFYFANSITKTPAKKIVDRLKREAKDYKDKGITSRMPESLEMPPLSEYTDEDKWVTINGKRVHKDSREYQKWYEEEGEFDDVEGREYRKRKF